MIIKNLNDLFFIDRCVSFLVYINPFNPYNNLVGSIISIFTDEETEVQRR